jgi:hypothetical protein
MQPSDEPDYLRYVVRVRDQLGEQVFDALKAEGAAMPFEDAIRYALAEDGGLPLDLTED